MLARSHITCAALLALFAFGAADLPAWAQFDLEALEEAEPQWEAVSASPRTTTAADGPITYEWVLYPSAAAASAAPPKAALTLALDDVDTARGQVLIQQMWQAQGWGAEQQEALRWLGGRDYDAFLNWNEVPPKPHLLSRARAEEEGTKSWPEATPLAELVGRVLSLAGMDKADEIGPGFVYAIGEGDVAVTPSLCVKYKKMERRARPIRPEPGESAFQSLRNLQLHLRARPSSEGGGTFPEVALTAQAPGEIALVPKRGWERTGALIAVGDNVRWFLGVDYDLSGGIGIALGYGEFVSQAGGSEDITGRPGFAIYGTLSEIIQLFK